MRYSSSLRQRPWPVASTSAWSSSACPRYSVVDQVPVESGAHQFLIRRPHLVWNVLRNLKAPGWILAHALQVPHHDADHVVCRQRGVRIVVEIVAERHLRGGHPHRLLRPTLAEGRVAATLHVRLLHDDEGLRIEAALGEERLREGDVLAGVR